MRGELHPIPTPQGPLFSGQSLNQSKLVLKCSLTAKPLVMGAPRASLGITCSHYRRLGCGGAFQHKFASLAKQRRKLHVCFSSAGAFELRGLPGCTRKGDLGGGPAFGSRPAGPKRGPGHLQWGPIQVFLCSQNATGQVMRSCNLLLRWSPCVGAPCKPGYAARPQTARPLLLGD